MIRLDDDGRTLQAILAGAISTTNPDVTVSFTDYGNKLDPSKPVTTKLTAMNGANAVTICDAPDKGVTREVDSIDLHNRDTATVTATIRYNDNGTTYKIITAALLTGESLHYAQGGWRALDANGNLKQ